MAWAEELRTVGPKNSGRLVTGGGMTGAGGLGMLTGLLVCTAEPAWLVAIAWHAYDPPLVGT